LLVLFFLHWANWDPNLKIYGNYRISENLSRATMGTFGGHQIKTTYRNL